MPVVKSQDALSMSFMRHHRRVRLQTTYRTTKKGGMDRVVTLQTIIRKSLHTDPRIWCPVIQGMADTHGPSRPRTATIPPQPATRPPPSPALYATRPSEPDHVHAICRLNIQDLLCTDATKKMTAVSSDLFPSRTCKMSRTTL